MVAQYIPQGSISQLLMQTIFLENLKLQLPKLFSLLIHKSCFLSISTDP